MPQVGCGLPYAASLYTQKRLFLFCHRTSFDLSRQRHTPTVCRSGRSRSPRTPGGTGDDQGGSGGGELVRIKKLQPFCLQTTLQLSVLHFSTTWIPMSSTMMWPAKGLEFTGIVVSAKATRDTTLHDQAPALQCAVAECSILLFTASHYIVAHCQPDTIS